MNDSAMAKKRQSMSTEAMDQQLLDAARRADLDALLEAARARQAANPKHPYARVKAAAKETYARLPRFSTHTNGRRL